MGPGGYGDNAIGAKAGMAQLTLEALRIHSRLAIARG